MIAESANPAIWPLVLYFAAVIVLIAGTLGLSYVLGQRHMQRSTGKPYESGIIVTGSARTRVPVKFYLMALLFVIFDVESIFLFAWAISLRQVGWQGYIEALVFILILLAALVYLWKQGALNWGPARRTARNKQEENAHE